jgi:hypothetical protein
MAQDSTDRSNAPTKYSEQAMLGMSFDEDFKENTVEVLGFDGSNLQRISTDTTGKLNTNVQGVATEDSLMLLRSIRGLLESSGFTDVAQRQIVRIGAVGNISGGAELTNTMPVSGSVTATVASTTITQTGGFDARFQIYDLARVKYATGIRANLAFT